ncbi:MAG: cyclopropane fatty acyl phospholipid synthase [Proteobacteria bacterium]|nr:cyclopropane fatty acyl phospholipid synthase [Pseudomonadota bacterium]MBU1387996.1 cyclopropane fatty acyl phospholipid synthase [Pseudomonadota bacterium]MBU1542059.1 cyclopropane fatty acyl phospholipid synthase [Pseudomonadota bacterium]MBU2431152.1 cyclopropane fatty acyl phospholipid synthase [Pseudomonadota bacterium]MBU2482843.1 cyclopropane fatty acyl phospholipid synthase [Pseudomonadota bacterium]
MIARKIEQILAQAGVAINGSQPWDIQVHDKRWFRRVLFEKNLGLGESYMDGWWDCEQLDEMIYRLLRNGLENHVKGGLRYLLHFIPGLVFNLQSRARSHIIAERHYDLDNELFLSFLDANHQYSCAYFDSTNDLDEAQRKKLDLIARKLQISKEDHLLDIGCGWGGLSRYFAEKYGCKVTAVNISREQLEHAKKICEGLPVSFHDCDYREIDGIFDKAVSVGMFEHVGSRNYRTFMDVVHSSLKEDGIFLLHTIGSNVSRSNCDPWINKYIFPNGMLPSQKQIAKEAENLFVIEDVHNLGPHYDKTLMAWNRKFQSAWAWLSRKYNSRFKRMWEYYLLSCAGAFRARNIQVWQILMTKHGCGTPQPCYRLQR